MASCPFLVRDVMRDVIMRGLTPHPVVVLFFRPRCLHATKLAPVLMIPFAFLFLVICFTGDAVRQRGDLQLQGALILRGGETAIAVACVPI